MSNFYSNQGSSKPEDANHLHHETKDEERCEAVWDDLAGFVQYCDEHNMDDAQTACAVLFVEAIAEQMAHDKTTIGDVTFDLIAGHHHLNQFVSRRLLEQMEALEVIKPPTIMDRWTRKTKQQIARRTLWDLGSTSKEFLDLTYIRGYERVKRNAGPHAQTSDSRDQHGDPNESIVHRYFVRAGELFYRHVRGYEDVRTYVRLGDLTDVDSNVANRRLDIVAYDANGNIIATAEAERHPVESTGVVRDAEAMALVPGDTDWIVYAKPQLNDLLDTLDQQLITRPDGIPGWSKRRTGKPDAMDRLRRVWNHPDGSIPRLESEIVTEVFTIDNLRALLRENVPYIFEPVDPGGITWVGDDN